MGRRRWLLVPVLVAALAVGGWLAVRALFDVGRHRAAVAELLAETTGWRAATGPLSLALFPAAAIDISGVTLVDPRGVSRLEARRAVVHARLVPLVGRRLEAREIELLRPELHLGRREARLVGPPLGAVARAARNGTGERLVEVRVRGGRVVVPPPAAARPGTADLVLEDVAAVFVPATGRLWGSARIDAGGRVQWLGHAGRRLEIDVDGLPAGLLASWLGLPGPEGGQVSGHAVRDPAGALEIDARGTDLDLPPAGAWRDVRVEGVLAAPGGEARPLEGTVHVAGLAIGLAGSLGSAPRLALSVRQAPAVPLLALAHPLVGFAIGASGPGTVDGSLDLVTPPGGDGVPEWRWEGRGRFARLAPAPGLPGLTGARAEARGGSRSPVSIRASGGLAGGRARLAVGGGDDGGLSWSVGIERAALEEVLAALAPDVVPAGALGGALDASGEGRTGPGGISAARLAVRIDPFVAPAWDLLDPWVRAVSRPDPEPSPDGTGNAPPVARPRSLEARVALRDGSFILEDVKIVASGATARGSGTYDPRGRRIELVLELVPAGKARRWLARGLSRAAETDPVPAPARRRLIIEGPPGAPAFRLEPEPAGPTPAGEGGEAVP